MLLRLSPPHHLSRVTQHYRLLDPPSNQVAHGEAQEDPGPPVRYSVRNNTINPAVQPPNTAVIVMYILSFAAAVIALSAPPGIAEYLVRGPNVRNVRLQSGMEAVAAYGLSAMLQMLWKTSAVCLSFTLTATGT